MANKIAVITGGSRGLGRSSAMHLAEEGVGVVLTYRSNEKAAKEVVRAIEERGGRAVALQLDTAKTREFPVFANAVQKALGDTWQRTKFDFLVNNAGHGQHKMFEETTEEDFDQLMAVLFKGVFFLTQTLLPMIEDGGKIVNVSSGLARFTLPGYATYGCMKGAVEVLTRYLAKELGPRGISVNTLAPGAIETDFGGGVVRDNAELNQMIAQQTAMGRVGLPDDIGKAVAAVLVHMSPWTTAQRIEVSGGQSI